MQKAKKIRDEQNSEHNEQNLKELSTTEKLPALQAESSVVSEQKQPAQQQLATNRGLSKDRIEEMRNQLSLLQEFVAKVMIRGEHYGVIPGTSKPTLLKAGAEFLREAYGFEVRSQCVEKKFIPAAETAKGKDYIEYTYRVELLQNGVSVSVCEGSCNNYERRYESFSPYAVLNTVQKMAQKRAYVGAVISATRSSNLFTQDLEDEPELATGPGSASKKQKAPGATIGSDELLPEKDPTARMATPGQAKLIWARVKNELKLNDFAAREYITKHSGKAHSRDLTSADVEALLQAIDADVSAAQKTA